MTGYPQYAERCLQDVLRPDEVDALRELCRWVAGRVDAPQRMAYLSSYAQDVDGWAEVVAAALATEPNVVESWLLGGAPVPGSMERLRRARGVATYAEAASMAQEREARARAQRVAELSKRAHGGGQAPVNGLPRDWLDRASAAPLLDVVEQLGLRVRGNGLGPCPCCGADRRGEHDKRPPVLLLHGGSGWRCLRCDASGGSLMLVQATLHGRPRWTSPEERTAVGAWMQARGWV